MKQIRPSIWAMAVFAIGITVLCGLYLARANKQKAELNTQAMSVSESVSEEVLVIHGQPEMPATIQNVTNLVETKVTTVTNDVFQAGFEDFVVK